MTATLRVRVSANGGGTAADLGVDLSVIAQLAFGRAGDDSVAEGRHLALLPIESLELDLSDPAQCQFGEYELLEPIGEGGMGVVYRARQRSLDREVAIKLLAAGVWASAEFIERFRREAQNAARMQHPNIVPVYEVGDHDGLHFFSMRLIGGPSLAAELKREKKLSPSRAAHLLRTIAEAVDYAHRLGVMHLDLKPANVLIDENGIPHVADFGLARRIDSAADSDEVSGTPSYMAPEQASPRASGITRATDIWGLGAILYELVTGEPPFLAHSPQETLKLVVEGSLRSPRRYVPELPRDLEAIILKCMAYRVEKRYASARDVADDLSRFIEGRAVFARPLNAAQRALRWARREPKLAAMTACAFAALLIGLAATTKQWQRADDNAQHAEANAAVANERLWDSRDNENLRMTESGDGWSAAALLLANTQEMEADGASERALAARKRLGILEALNSRLIDVIDAPNVRGLAFSPDGETLAISSEGKLQVLNLASGVSRNLGHPVADMEFAVFQRMSFSADGRRLTVEVPQPMPSAPLPPGFQVQIDLATGTQRLSPAEFTARNSWAVLAASFSADGDYAVLTDADTRSQVWATDPWRALSPKRHLSMNPGLPFVYAQFAPDHSYFAYTHKGGLAFVDTHTLAETPVHLPAGFGNVYAWAISPDSRWLAISDREGHALAVDHATRAQRPLEPRPPFAIDEFNFSSDGARLAGAAGRAGVYLWRWPAGELISPPFGAPAAQRVTLDDGERVLASGDAATSLWQAPPAAFDADRTEAVRLGSSATLNAAAWHPASGLFAAALDGLRVSRLPAPVLKHARASPLQPTTLRFDGRYLATVDGNRVQIVDAESEAPVVTAIEFSEPPSCAELSADAATLVVVSGRRLYVYDATSGAPRFDSIELANSPLHVEISPDGRHVATGWLDHGENGTGETLETWNLATGLRAGGPARVPGPLAGVLFSASGQRLAAWSAEQLSLRDGRTLEPVAGPLADLRAPSFRGRREAGEFGVTAFAGEQFLFTALHGNGSEYVDAELQRQDVDGRSHSESISLDWQGMLPLPGTQSLLIVPAGDPLALRAADGTQRELGGQDVVRPGQSPALAVSADGRWLATATRDGADLFDARDRKRLVRLHVPLPLPDRVWQLAFSSNGDRLLGRSVRNRLMVWSVAADMRPVAEIRRELELRGIDHRESKHAALLTLTADERTRLHASDPGPPASIPVAARPAAARVLPGGIVLPRSTEAPDTTLDLTTQYNLALSDLSRNTLRAPTDYAWLPQGVQRLLGVDFDIRGAIQLSHPSGFVERATSTGPIAVHMPVGNRKAAAIDLLLLQNYGGLNDENGKVANVTFDYADRTAAELPIHTGVEVFMWRQQSVLGDKARLATLGFDARVLPGFLRPVRIYSVRLINPHPEKALRAVTLAAAPGVGGGLVFFAATLETATPSDVSDAQR
jgi:WD40 repeat protein